MEVKWFSRKLTNCAHLFRRLANANIWATEVELMRHALFFLTLYMTDWIANGYFFAGNRFLLFLLRTRSCQLVQKKAQLLKHLQCIFYIIGTVNIKELKRKKNSTFA